MPYNFKEESENIIKHKKPETYVLVPQSDFLCETLATLKNEHQTGAIHEDEFSQRLWWFIREYGVVIPDCQHADHDSDILVKYSLIKQFEEDNDYTWALCIDPSVENAAPETWQRLMEHHNKVDRFALRTAQEYPHHQTDISHQRMIGGPGL